MKKITLIFLLFCSIVFGQDLGNPAIIGQTNRNQKVGKGFQVEDTLLTKGKIVFSGLVTYGTTDTILGVKNGIVVRTLPSGGGGGVSLSALNDTIARQDAKRKVDSTWQLLSPTRDSTYYYQKINGITYLTKIRDSIGIHDAPFSDLTYGRRNGTWVSVSSGGGSDLATLIDACPNVDLETLNGSETFPILKDDTVYQLSLGDFANLIGGGGGGVPEAPNDGQLYGRQNNDWSVVPINELPSTDSLEFFTDTSTTSPGHFQEYLGSKVKGRDIGTSGFTTYHQTIYGNCNSYSTMGNASSYILIDDNNDVQIVAQFGKLKIYPPNWDSQPYGSVLTLIGANGECEWQSVLRGTATLSSGTVIVSTDKVKTGYKIYVSVNTPSGTQGFLSAPTGSIVDATSFVINSTNAGDNSTVNWWIAP